MKFLLSFICISLSLIVLVGCGDKMGEAEDATHPVINGVAEPTGEENAFEQLFEDKEDTVVVRPSVPTSDGNAFEDLFGDKEETVPTKKPLIPVLPIADPVADPVADPIAEPVVDTTDDGGNAFEDLFNK